MNIKQAMQVDGKKQQSLKLTTMCRLTERKRLKLYQV